MDYKYLDVSGADAAYRLESFRSHGTVSSNNTQQLRCYFIAKCSFKNPSPTAEDARDIRNVSDATFLAKATQNTLEIYQHVMNLMLQRTGPVIEMYQVEGTRERRLVIAYRQRTTQRFFSAMSDLYHFYDLYSSRKYVEQFSNGVTIMSLYLNPLPNSKAPPIESSIYQVIREASLIYCLPTTSLQKFFQTNVLSVQEAIYGHVGWIFAQHFLNRLGNAYSSLVRILDNDNPVHVEVLSNIKTRLREDTFSGDYILDIIKAYPNLLKLLYINFAMTHYINTTADTLQPTLSYQRLQTDHVLTDEELHDKIRRSTNNAHEALVMESFLVFNKHILKTNFYQPTKVALSFRLGPGFLPEIEYPQKPYGLIFIVSSECRGFHVRIGNIARGGVRMIRSRNKEAYANNTRTLFDENYALATTQHRKNKDIPEAGSKGTILLDFEHQDKAREAFMKWVDALLDLLIVGETPGIKDKIVDLTDGTDNIIFLGPDEGTADYMDWASAHAKERGFPFWKAFTTGKSQALGGIPHDIYGMTTRSVHQNVLGIYRKLGLVEKDISKLQTGGPDGDLGSNEIKISHDKTTSIVDGSGVLYDPEGINRTELTRLANARQMISAFDVSKLSSKGFRVLVDETDVKLPNGDVVEDGASFRNGFHLNPLAAADLFVPCGGRPESINVNNVTKLVDREGHARFKYIVEGANLFITQEARLRLEKAGAIIIKDATANKGGVTSSSLEVLAALAFGHDDAGFQADMQVLKDAKSGQVVTPEFYSAYVKQVQAIIEENARMEFECIWREHKRTKSSRSLISDELSFAIVRLNAELQQTTLWDNLPLRKLVLLETLPKLLVEKMGLETLVKRVPENYMRAIFGSYLASRFVYKYGTQPSQFAFFEFMAPRFAQLERHA